MPGPSSVFTFKPHYPSQRVWMYWLIAFALAGIIAYKTEATFAEIAANALLIAVIIIYSIINIKEPVRLTINTDTKTLTYVYLNALRQTKHQTINLVTALGNYKYTQLSKYTYGWRIKLYEGWWFKNRLILKEDDSAGFSKRQLDEIVDLIEGCKGGTSD